MKNILQEEVYRIDGEKAVKFTDSIAAEEPLEIKIEYGEVQARKSKNISITMRTPGDDEQLVIGFLHTEGILNNYDDVESINSEVSDENSVTVHLNANVKMDLSKLERNFYTTSSCGVCGKASIDAVKTVIPDFKNSLEDWKIAPSIIKGLSEKIKEAQHLFNTTGGLHAATLFDKEGKLLLLKEDVGRHNALDKLIGSAVQQRLLPLDHHILLLSGRISFELVQKAAMAGIKVIVAIGAPSSLAIQIAKETGITLCGFLKSNRFNLYTGPARVSFVS